MATTVPISLKIHPDIKQSLQVIAKTQKRSVHGILCELVENFVKEQQMQDEHQAWIEEQVIAVYQRVQHEGWQGTPSTQVHADIRAKMRQYAGE